MTMPTIHVKGTLPTASWMYEHEARPLIEQLQNRVRELEQRDQPATTLCDVCHEPIVWMGDSTVSDCRHHIRLLTPAQASRAEISFCGAVIHARTIGENHCELPVGHEADHCQGDFHWWNDSQPAAQECSACSVSGSGLCEVHRSQAEKDANAAVQDVDEIVGESCRAFYDAIHFGCEKGMKRPMHVGIRAIIPIIRRGMVPVGEVSDVIAHDMKGATELRTAYESLRKEKLVAQPAAQDGPCSMCGDGGQEFCERHGPKPKSAQERVEEIIAEGLGYRDTAHNVVKEIAGKLKAADLVAELEREEL